MQAGFCGGSGNQTSDTLILPPEKMDKSPQLTLPQMQLEMKFLEKLSSEFVNRVTVEMTTVVWPCRKNGYNKDTEKVI
jgi:hypothetical protein